jgi:hypothetical protein
MPWYGAEMVAFAAALVAEAEGDESRAFQALRRYWQYDLEREIATTTGISARSSYGLHSHSVRLTSLMTSLR